MSAVRDHDCVIGVVCAMACVGLMCARSSDIHREMANVAPQRYTRPLNIRVDDEFVAAVQELRRLDEDVPSQSEAIRRAVFESLDRKKRGARRLRD